MTTDTSTPRFQACHLLHEHEIPCVIWDVDAVAHYGVRTALFDLFLLVPEIDTAARALEQCGWTHDKEELHEALYPFAGCIQRRLSPPSEDTSTTPSEEQNLFPRAFMPKTPEEPTTTVLLPANSWNFNFDTWVRDRAEDLAGAGKGVFIPLVGFLDSLIDNLLETPVGRLQAHLAMQSSLLYKRVSRLQDPMFALQLAYEHRQFHFDAIAGIHYGEGLSVAHHREVRDGLRAGTRTL